MDPAPRSSRFFAALADAFVLAIPYGLGSVERLAMPVRLVCFAGVLGLMVYQLVLLTKQGQTIGKKLLGIKIALKETGENGGFATNVLKRGLLSGLLNLIPLYFLVDSLFIFREDRRCVHDLIAGTVVVKA